MLCCLDFGNTRVKTALFSAQNIEVHRTFDYDQLDTFSTFLSDFQINEIAFADVSGKKSLAWREFINKTYTSNTFEVSYKNNLPFELDYNTPETLGNDRIALVAAAGKYLNLESALIIDIGTAVTYDFIEKNRIYRGGIISPGINMRIEAMNRHAANLPIVEKKMNENILGKSTIECLQNGAIRALLMEIKCTIAELKSKFDQKLLVFLTGGDAHFFENKLENIKFASEFLVLEGVSYLKQYNSH